MKKTFLAIAKTISKNLKAFIIATLAMAASYGLAFGLYNIDLLSIANLRENSTIQWYHYAFIISASLLGGTAVALWRDKGFKKECSLAAVGSVAGLVGMSCPVCLGVELIFLGIPISILSPYLVAYVPFIMLGSVILLAAGVWLTARR